MVSPQRTQLRSLDNLISMERKMLRHGLARPDMTAQELREFTKTIRAHLNLPALVLPPTRPLITLISRARSPNTKNASKPRRYIINEADIAHKLRFDTSLDVQLVNLETLSIKEQITLMGRTSVLFGVHSSALLHVAWMRPGSAVVQLHLPNTQLGSHAHVQRDGILSWYSGVHPSIIMNIENLAEKAGVRYFDCWPNKTVGASKKVSECSSKKTLSMPCLSVVQQEEIIFRETDSIIVDSEHVADLISKLAALV
ncbi:hypothetical protein CYMTET_4927 [Cymbomonas tetramitiformis]|uniref:Glycosyltransferase 61 catalytic domain-containing protein n=1 Tax=Cymbomonas tetramitiformis TaxID=36881 RepID=A0AAE0H0E6_9CHLO|nr:hypothetical protein CYMTET_4927 [Cymbomonas tetramitiformis]